MPLFSGMGSLCDLRPQADKLPVSGNVAQNAGQFKQPATLVLGDRIVGPHQIQGFFIAHQVCWHRIRSAVIRRSSLKPFKEKTDLNVQRIGNIPQTRRAYAIRTGFIFLNLLELDSTCSASCCCVIPTSQRLWRTRFPTCTSTGCAI